MKNKTRLKLLKKCKKQLKKIATYEYNIKKHLEFIDQEETKQDPLLVTGKAWYESQINHLKLDISIASAKFNEALKRIESI